MSEAEALLLDGSLRWAEHPSALEQGWLLAEMKQRFGNGLEPERRFDHKREPGVAAAGGSSTGNMSGSQAADYKA